MLRNGQAGTAIRRIALLVAALTLTAPALAEDDDSWEELFSDKPATEASADGDADDDGTAGSGDSAAEKDTAGAGSSAGDGGQATEPERDRPAGDGRLETIPVGEQPPPTVPPPRRVIEEIVVTAQKREQAVQDVPISMSALEQDFLIEQGVTDIRDAMLYVPNVQVDSAGFFAAPTMRGFSFNNNNKAFEPPVGIVQDGIPYTRVPYFMSALFDVRRIEVLRGPQGTTFGMNTTAGLIHLISNQPTDTFEGGVTVQYGELDRRRVEAGIGGPLLDGLNFRIAGLQDERDGFIRNTAAAVVPSAPSHFKDRSRTGVRFMLQAPDLWGSTLTLTGESVSLFDGGAALELLDAGPTFIETVQQYDPGFDTTPGNFVASEDFPGFRDITIKTIRGQLDLPIGNWDVVTLAAHSLLEQELSLDTDFTSAPAIFGTGADRSPMTHGETRLVSPRLEGLFGQDELLGRNLGHSEFLLGVTYTKRQMLDSFFRFSVNPVPFWQLVAAAGADVEGTPTGGILGPIPGLFPLPEVGLETMNQQFAQTATAAGVYATMKWQFLPQLAVELGGRYTNEEKDCYWNLVFETPPPNAALTAIGTEEFETTRERKESNFQPKASLNYKPLIDFGPFDSVNLFLHWAQGFKGGGCNAFAFREDSGENQEEDLEFEEETGTNWGFDIKTRMFGGAAQFNLSLFRQTATDFQSLIRQNPDGTVGLGTSAVVNAPAARAQGVEADLIWYPAEWLSVIFAVAYNHTEFLEFRNNECPVGKEPTGEGSRCDATGMPFPFAPRWNGALTMNLHGSAQILPWLGKLPSWRDVELFAGTTVEAASPQFLDTDLGDHPFKRQGSFQRYRLNLGLSHTSQQWSLRLVGENLTNTITHIRVGDIFEDVVHGSQNEPRLLYMQFRQDF